MDIVTAWRIFVSVNDPLRWQAKKWIFDNNNCDYEMYVLVSLTRRGGGGDLTKMAIQNTWQSLRSSLCQNISNAQNPDYTGGDVPTQEVEMTTTTQHLTKQTKKNKNKAMDTFYLELDRKEYTVYRIKT